MNPVEKVLQEEVFQVVRPIPFKGIEEFFDVSGLLKDPYLLKNVLDHLVDFIKVRKPTILCALDSRGFLFAPTVAIALNIPLVMIRKAGKLPGECARVSFNKEYESGDVFEIQKGAISESDRVIIIDDILATGGSMKAAFDLINSMRPQSVEGVCLIDLNLPGSRDYMREHSINVYSLFDASDWKKPQIGA
jgi:adenine phosphoribosyltransferase